MADAVEACGEHVEEKAADEFGYRQGHGLVPITVFGPVVLPLEGDLLVVEGDEAAVRDGDAVGVAGEIGEDRLGAAPAASSSVTTGSSITTTCSSVVGSSVVVSVATSSVTVG